MDSSIQSCETYKNYKPKLNATANTKPRRYNKMMCSNWKISVFGILALILAFGLVTTDAEAQPQADPSAVTVAVSSGDAELRASQEGRIITFAVTLNTSNTSDDGDIDQEGIIEIQVPRGEGWSSPRRVAGTGVGALENVSAGGVVFDPGGLLTIADDKISVGSHKLRVTVPDPPESGTHSGTITWYYKTNIPVKARNSNFRIISRVHKDDGPAPGSCRSYRGAGFSRLLQRRFYG